MSVSGFRRSVMTAFRGYEQDRREWIPSADSEAWDVRETPRSIHMATGSWLMLTQTSYASSCPWMVMGAAYGRRRRVPDLISQTMTALTSLPEAANEPAFSSW